ncbi:MAG: ferredoxin [Deltaproteobacteria bacterium]|nr:ferredoxin [Deltaproteobacteria bacterium]
MLSWTALRQALQGEGEELDELRERLRAAEASLASALQRERLLRDELTALTGHSETPLSDALRQARARDLEAPALPEGQVVVLEAADCVGCHTCVSLVPEVFAMDERLRVARVVSQQAPRDYIQDAIDSCPTACIRWEASDTP